MNTNVLSSFVSPAIPDVVKFGSTRQADAVLLKRETLRINSDAVGPFGSNATRQISFKLPAGSKFLDLSALRLLFTLQTTQSNNFIQDGCPIIRSVNVYINGLLVESISNFYSLFQNAMMYYTSHDSYFATQGVKNGFWSGSYGRFPKPSELFTGSAPPISVPPSTTNTVVYSGGSYFTESFEIPLSLLGICRCAKLFPALLCNSIQISIELNSKEQVLFQVMATSSINNAVVPPVTTYSIEDKPTCVGNVSDYQIMTGTAMLLCDSVDVTPEYANECYKVAQQGQFSFVIDSFDFVSNTCSNSLNNIVLTDAKTKLKDIYAIMKQNLTGQLTDQYYNPLLRRLQVTIGSSCFPSQAVGGRSTGVDSDILANNHESYDQLMMSFNELNNVLSMGIIPFKNKENGCCSAGQASVNNYKILVGNACTNTTTATFGNTHAYNGQRWMLGINLESNLNSLMSGTDSKVSGGLINILLETESTTGNAPGAVAYPILSTSPATILCLLHFDRQLVFSQGALYLVD